MRPWFVYTLHDPREPDVVRYVGWTTDPKRRLKAHVRDARSGRDVTRCGCWKKSLLTVGLLPVLTVIDSGVGGGYGASEMRWVAHFKSDKLTNLTDGGDGTIGRVNSPGHRAKISAARKGRKATPEARANMSAAHRGHKHTPEQTAKIANANRGRQQSDEERARRRGPKSPEAITRSAASRRGQKRSQEFCEKMRAVNQGRKLAPDHVAKVASAHRGSKRSPEARARIAEAVKAWHARRKSGG